MEVSLYCTQTINTIHRFCNSKSASLRYLYNSIVYLHVFNCVYLLTIVLHYYYYYYYCALTELTFKSVFESKRVNTSQINTCIVYTVVAAVVILIKINVNICVLLTGHASAVQLYILVCLCAQCTHKQI